MSKSLQMTPYAYSMTQWFRDNCKTEFLGFGITPKGRNNVICDLYIPDQEATAATVEVDEDALLKMVHEMDQKGLVPGDYNRYFIHTHPGNSPNPSSTDETTFREIFGKMDWACMVIFAKGGDQYVRTQYNVGPGATIKDDKVLVCLDTTYPGVTEETIAEWKKLKEERVKEKKYTSTVSSSHGSSGTTYVNKEKEATKGTNKIYLLQWGAYVDGEFINDNELKNLDISKYEILNPTTIPVRDGTTTGTNSHSESSRNTTKDSTINQRVSISNKREKKLLKQIKRVIESDGVDEPKLSSFSMVDGASSVVVPEGTAKQQLMHCTGLLNKGSIDMDTYENLFYMVSEGRVNLMEKRGFVEIQPTGS